MSHGTIVGGTLLAAMVALAGSTSTRALPLSVSHSATSQAAHNLNVVEPVAKKGGAARSGSANVKRSSTNVKRSTNVNRNTNVNVNRRTNVNVVRPVRAWTPRPYYGTIVGGVALGTAIAVATAGAVPTAPAPNMCWFWMDSAQMQGYWDYCRAP